MSRIPHNSRFDPEQPTQPDHRESPASQQPTANSHGASHLFPYLGGSGPTAGISPEFPRFQGVQGERPILAHVRKTEPNSKEHSKEHFLYLRVFLRKSPIESQSLHSELCGIQRYRRNLALFLCLIEALGAISSQMRRASTISKANALGDFWSQFRLRSASSGKNGRRPGTPGARAPLRLTAHALDGGRKPPRPGRGIAGSGC